MTNAETAVVGLLLEEPRHGYDIERVVAERGMRDWTDLGFSSIYYLLAKLEKRGLVVAREEPTGHGPSRKVYAPTAEGARQHAEAVRALLSRPHGPSPFLLGLGNVAALPEAEALDALRSYRDALAERLSAVSDRAGSTDTGAWFVEALFDYSTTMLSAERDWVARLVEKLEREQGEVAAMSAEVKLKKPEIVEMPARTMAVVKTVGDPNDVGGKVFPALYGALYPLKFGLKKQGVEFKMEPVRARWFGGPDWKNVPRDQWRAEWAIPVPDGTTELTQKDPETPVAIETWEYGTTAQILHVGTYAEEEPAIQRLHEFIAEEGYEIVGPHEEEYRTRPDAKSPKTVIRYSVRKLG